MIIRSRKLFLIFIFFIFIFFVYLQFKTGAEYDKLNTFKEIEKKYHSRNVNLEEKNTCLTKTISCDINFKKKVKCYKDESDVYIPFKQVIKKQFDVSGKLNQGKIINIF